MSGYDKYKETKDRATTGGSSVTADYGSDSASESDFEISFESGLDSDTHVDINLDIHADLFSDSVRKLSKVHQFHQFHQMTQSIHGQDWTMTYNPMFDAERSSLLESFNPLDINKLISERMSSGLNFESAVDHEGNTVLHLAVNSRSIDAIHKLKFVVNASMVMAVNRSGKTPLSLAAEMGDRDLFLALLEIVQKEKGWDRNIINSKDIYGHSLIELALKSEDLSLFEMLVNLGADLNTRDLKNNTVLHQAVMKPMSYANLRKLLVHIDRMDINAVNHLGETALNTAIKMGDQLNVIRELLKAKPSFTIEDAFGNTPLHLAAREGDKDLISLLVSHGASPSVKDSFGDTPLHFAVRKGNKALMGILIEHGADPHTTNKSGYSALHEATMMWRCVETEAILNKPSEGPARD